MKKVILTGDRPTGRLHVGHYVGSHYLNVSDCRTPARHDEIGIMIADAQALTDNAEHPEKVRREHHPGRPGLPGLRPRPGEIHDLSSSPWSRSSPSSPSTT